MKQNQPWNEMSEWLKSDTYVAYPNTILAVTFISPGCTRIWSFGFLWQKKKVTWLFIVANDLKHSKCSLIIINLESSFQVTFCGTCPAGTHWVRSLSPAFGSVYSAHTHSAWMCRRPVHRWEPWNCCHNSHNRVRRSTTILWRKGEKWSLLFVGFTVSQLEGLML